MAARAEPSTATFGHVFDGAEVARQRRFDAALNEWHCRLNGCLLLNPHHRPVFTAHVYAEMPRHDVNVAVYNLKIELAATALRSFLEPCAEVSPSRRIALPDAAYCHSCSVVCVCLLVTTLSRTKTAESTEVPFCVRTWVGPRNSIQY